MQPLAEKPYPQEMAVNGNGHGSNIGGHGFLKSSFEERFNLIDEAGHPKLVTHSRTICTDSKIPKLGLMIVGLGGNNGSTLAASLLAHQLKVSWETKDGMQTPNYYGSYT